MPATQMTLPIQITPGETIDAVKVVGVTFDNRQGFLWWLKRHPTEGKLFLRREKKNPADANAIKVMTTRAGHAPLPLGYIPRALASDLAPMMDAGYRVYVNGYDFVGGDWPDFTLGLRLRLRVANHN